jgi:2-keto-3-deoxy-L-rhamnonate aldolase RhmA
MPLLSFKQKLKERRGQVGIRSQTCSPLIVEALGYCGYDYVYIDMEHAPNELLSVVQQSQAVAATDADTVVRIPSNDAVLIARLLDGGIRNIVVPMVNSGEEARMAVAATRYPPEGLRGAAVTHRGSHFGAIPNYLASASERICVVVQIESRQGLDALEDIASTPGLDGILFGPADLAADLGYLGRSDHRDVQDEIERALPIIKAAGKAAGMSTSKPEHAKHLLSLGFDFVSTGGDMELLVKGARALRAAVDA